MDLFKLKDIKPKKEVKLYKQKPVRYDRMTTSIFFFSLPGPTSSFRRARVKKMDEKKKSQIIKLKMHNNQTNQKKAIEAGIETL